MNKDGGGLGHGGAADTPGPKAEVKSKAKGGAKEKRVETHSCHNCGEAGHLAAQCPNPPQCHCCGSTQHAKKDCTKLGSTCDLCGKTGHLKVKCRQQGA